MPKTQRISLLVVALFVSSAALAQTQAVTGSGTAGGATFAVDAVSDAAGTNAQGTVTFNLATGTLEGDVGCMMVIGNQATVGGVVVAGSTAAAPGSGFVLHVSDGASNATQDLLLLELVPAPPASCPAPNLLTPTAVTSGDISVVTNVTPTPTLKGLIDKVKALNLPRRLQGTLLAKLCLANWAVNNNRTQIACRSLTAFIREVQRVSGRKIPTTAANSLISDAQAIQAQLGC